MLDDDTGDADRTGIPDALQLDEVVAPQDPEPFSSLAPDAGVPEITEPADERALETDQDPPLARPPSAANKAAEAADRYIRE